MICITLRTSHEAFLSLLYRMYMVVLCVVCCICIHWCIVFTMHVWGVLCTYGLPYHLPKFQIQILGPPFTLFKTPTEAFHTSPSLTNTYSHIPHWIQPALWLNWLPTLCYWAILHYNTGVYRYYFHYVSGLKFFMIGLNRLIHVLTQALPNMKLKKESCQIFTKVRCTNLHGGRV